jgi:precorrin isomerase
MGLEHVVPGDPPPLIEVLARLAADGVAAMIAMVDGQLVMPTAAPPATWREVRLRTPAGTITLARRPTGTAIVVFGNADPALVAAQQAIARALAPI